MQDSNFTAISSEYFLRWRLGAKDFFLEIGCARSRWLPYFAKEFGFEVSGIDYSEVGSQQATQILFNEGVQGNIVFADSLHQNICLNDSMW